MGFSHFFPQLEGLVFKKSGWKVYKLLIKSLLLRDARLDLNQKMQKIP